MTDPLAPKVTKPKQPKIDPLTGLPEVKMPKIKTAIVPQGKSVQQRIQSMMTDKRYGERNDDRLRNHIQQQFQNAFPGTVQYDETGKMQQPVPVIKPDEVEPFDPDGELVGIKSPIQPDQVVAFSEQQSPPFAQSEDDEDDYEDGDDEWENDGLRPDEEWDGTEDPEPTPEDALADACRLHRHRSKYGRDKAYKEMLDEVIGRYGGYKQFYNVLEENDRSDFPASCE